MPLLQAFEGSRVEHWRTSHSAIRGYINIRDFLSVPPTGASWNTLGFFVQEYELRI